ncbi:MAG: hypothetical protein FWH24_02715 [Oscillospiraceae bacterium]|nr:hypothetical protein [Oscillospiraceae bacterium]
MYKKKVIFLTFSVIAALCLTVSCGDNGQPAADPAGYDEPGGAGQDGEGAQTGEETSDPEKVLPDLPEMDFDGYVFTFFAHRIDYTGDGVGDSDPNELVVEEMNGEPINDAVYQRNMTVKEKYNIDIRMLTDPDDVGVLRRAVGAGDNIYDAAVIFNNLVPGVVTNNLLVNIEQLPYVDTAKPWWDPAVKSMSVSNQNYLLGGDLLILDNEATNAMLFNKELLTDLGFDELPYQTVKDGKWTMDVVNGMSRDAAYDLNGDGAMGIEDRWGFSVYNDTLHALLVSGGEMLAKKDGNDIPFMSFMEPRSISVIEKSMDLMYNPDYVINISESRHGDYNIYRHMFEEDRLLFLWMRMRVVEFFRGMDSAFGILPLPKYDEAQPSYHSVVNPYTGVLIGVPKSAENLERVSIILEALAAESRYTLQPAYYDVALTRKYTRDDESAEMLDMIFDSRVYDIGAVYSFGNVFLDFIRLTERYDRNISSYYDRRSPAMENDIAKVAETFSEMK